MKKIFYVILILIATKSYSQVYNNEWIDYSKTYYKFKVADNKLHRIAQTVLQTAGLSATPAQNFQLFRNGKQVPIYTSIATGVFGASDYIEFWGVPNDGIVDTVLYDNPANHYNRKWSLINDTASYYLTVNTNTAQNLRLVNTTNNVAGNVLPVEPNFLYTKGDYPKARINEGFAAVVGELLHASIYDKGEGWSTADIYPSDIYNVTWNNLYPDLSSTYLPKYTVAASGNALNQREIISQVNGSIVLNQTMNFFDANIFNVSLSNTSLSSGSANINIGHTGSPGSDRMVVAYQELTYARLFNFGGESNFEFSLEANPAGNYLEINNFNAASTTPILYDLTNGKRYVAVVAGTTYKFALQGSAVKRNLVLVNQSAANINNVAALQTKTFTNLMSASYQGDYLILSSTALHNAADVNNPVEKYKAYRISALGGGYNVKIIDVEDLYEQYSFGIDRHPLALRNYLRQARNQFTVAPKFVFIIGRGVAYNEARISQSEIYTNQLNLVPTFGYPASDNLLTAEPGTYTQTTPIGRIGAINTTEVNDYLNKIKEFEAKQAETNFTIANKAWMLTSAFVAGSSEPFLQTIIDNYQLDYMKVWGDTLVGGKSYLFTKSAAGGATPLTNSFMEQTWNTGQSLLEYFGHSSATTLEFNLDDPYVYNNQGKYPMMIINGCNAGNYFIYNPFRITTNNNQSLSEKFTLVPNRGSIGFIASTSFGVVNYLHFYNLFFQKALTGPLYGKSVGEIMKRASADMFSVTGTTDYYAQLHSEQILLQGDPAVRLNVSYPKPDYVIENQTVSINPDFVSVANDSFKVNMYYMNLGKASKNDTININVQRQFPNGTTSTIYNKRVKAAYYSDTMSFSFAIKPLTDKGLNKITIKIDGDNEKDEMSETNNTITKDVYINEFEAKPIFPYNYAIVNTLPVKLVASSANPLATSRVYNMELDTTELFNSPLKTTQTLTQVGGLLEFAPVSSLIANKTYYWRVASAGSVPAHWNTYSFTYLPSETLGFNQGHLYQHLKSTYDGIRLDSISRKFSFDSIGENISIRNGVWPTAAYEEGHLTVAVNQDAYIRGFCRMGEYERIALHVFDPITGKPWQNVTTGSQGLYNSGVSNCAPGREYNFEYSYATLASRNNIMNFLENNVPVGHYVVMRNLTFSYSPANFVDTWIPDAAANGNGKSLYNTLKAFGINKIDSFNTYKSFIYVFKKGQNNIFTPVQIVSEGIYDRIGVATTFDVSDTSGSIISPKFGPAKQWNQVHWRGTKSEVGNGDNVNLIVYGVDNNNVETQLFQLDSTQKDFNISTVNATQYPFIKLKLVNSDGTNATPWQLDYWRLNYVPVPEGAVAPNIEFQLKDTFNYAENINAILAFKNISIANFNSVKVKIMLIDSNNVTQTLLLPNQKALIVNDTIRLNYNIPNTNLAGNYTVIFDFNPDSDQPEQFHFNNLLYKNIYVRPNTLPVNWLRVNAQLQNNKSLITWSTAQETNSKKFEVEHSIDGRNFTYIGEVAAAGYSSTVRNYSLIHQNPINAINYYRIKQIDLDGSFKYSIIVSVLKRNNLNETIVGPNPAADLLSVFEPKAKFVSTAEVFNAEGKLITKLNINNTITSFVLPVSNLSSGNYVLKINYENEQKAYKFIKK